MCEFVRVCLSFTALSALMLISVVQTLYYQNQHETSKVLNLGISLKALCSNVMASFTSLIGAAIYEVLFVSYSYPKDDTETATFDHIVLLAMVHNGGVRLSYGGKILASVHDQLKHGFSTHLSER